MLDRGKKSSKNPTGAYSNVPVYNLPHLIEAKFKPPYSTSAWVARKRLISQINRGLDYKVLLLSAPMGSGKTTLLSQWYRHMLPTRNIAWLSLDEYDHELRHFFSYLAESLHRTVNGFEACLPGQSGGNTGVPHDYMTGVFLESLNKMTHDLVVILDDFQFVTDTDTLDAFSLLLQHSPPNIHWIISCRMTPSLNLSRLTLQDQLFVVGSDDLKFDADNIYQLGHRLNGFKLGREDTEYLYQRTEGWVAGVKLAILSSGGQSHPGQALRQFTGSNRDVAKYLAHSILGELPTETYVFLVKSSLVDTVSGDLCNALLDISHGQALLEDLEQAHLFIQPLDNRRQWYRYHSLFLDFLRSCLQRDFADQLPSLHKTASEWFAAHQMYYEALGHAFAAADRHWCARLLERFSKVWMDEGEVGEILKWVKKFGVEDILAYPAICVNYIISLILARRFSEAAGIIQEMEARVRPDKENKQNAHADLQPLNLMLATLTESATGINSIESNPEEEDRYDSFLNNGFLRAAHLNVQAYCLLGQHQFDRTRRLALRARDLLKHSNSVYALGYSDVLICLADQAQGNLKAAINNCENGFARVKNMRHNPTWVNAATILAHMRYEQNRLDEAEALCTEVLPLLSVASTIENLVLAYMTLARVKAIKGNLSETFQLLDHLHSLLESGNYKRFLAQVCFEKIRLCLLQQEMARARTIAAEFSLPVLAQAGEWQTEHQYQEGWERLGFAQASLLTAENCYPEALSILKTLRESAHFAGYVYREIPLCAALASCYWRAGEQMASFVALNQGLALNQEPGFTRSIFDEVAGIEVIIDAARHAGKLNHPLPKAYYTRFADLFSENRIANKGGNSSLMEPLTDRELEMLRLLSSGLSNKKISEHSGIALSTTKWHLKNVFAKLDVKTRTEAIVRAHALELIDSPIKKRPAQKASMKNIPINNRLREESLRR